MGGRSRAAAQLLKGKGFEEVYNLKGGMMAWQGLSAFGPAEIGMVYLRGVETPADIVLLAYGMEEGLGQLYLRLAEMTEDAEVRGLLSKLAGIEKKHKERLYEVYLTFHPSVEDRQVFEDRVKPGVMEGGFTVEEYLEENKPALQTTENVLNMAMMLETQALDLYLRYSQKVRNAKGEEVLNDLAEEEKAHLAALARLVEARV